MSWSDNLAATDALVAGYFDETAIRAIGMTKPTRAVNAEVVLDDARPGFDFLGTIELDPEIVDGTGMDGQGPRSRAARQVARVCLTALANSWPWMPRQGDRFEVGPDAYVVAAGPDRDGTQRVAYWLNKAS